MSDENEKLIASEVIRDIQRIKDELESGVNSKDYAVLAEKVKTSTEILEELSLYCNEVVGPDRVLTMSLNVFLKDCITTWKKKFWSIEITGKSQGSLEIECSRVRLKRVFENLILNSMEAGATEVEINVTKEGVEFIDDGPGISPEDSAQIKENGTTKGKGRGMGLKMVKSFLMSIGYSLELKNNQNEGLTVFLRKGGS